MKKEPCLTGPCGGTLLGFLTVLGTATILARQEGEIDLRWKWEHGQWYGYLRGELPANLTTLAEQIHKTLTSLQDHPLWLTCLPDADRPIKIKSFPSVPDERAPVCLNGIGPILTTTEELRPWYQLTRGDHWKGIMWRTFQETNLVHLKKALIGPWNFDDPTQGMGLRLSPMENCRYARQWYAPTKDPRRRRQGAMFGANRLALESYVWWDALGNEENFSQVGWQIQPGKTHWTWALWREWLPVIAWRTVFSMVSLQTSTPTETHRQDWTALGLSAICRVRRILRDQTLFFLPAEYVCLKEE